MRRINRKSQGLSINVVIIAVLALVVLVVLTAVFTGRIRMFSQNLESCAAKQGQCKSQCGPNEAVITNTNCPEGGDPNNKKCCVQVLS